MNLRSGTANLVNRYAPAAQAIAMMASKMLLAASTPTAILAPMAMPLDTVLNDLTSSNGNRLGLNPVIYCGLKFEAAVIDRPKLSLHLRVVL